MTSSSVVQDTTTAFYDDGNATNAGTGNYALITDFNPNQDVIQLYGDKANYRLVAGTTNGIAGTAIYIDKPGSEPDELIAIIQGVTGLDINSSAFVIATDTTTPVGAQGLRPESLSGSTTTNTNTGSGGVQNVASTTVEVGDVNTNTNVEGASLGGASLALQSDTLDYALSFDGNDYVNIQLNEPETEITHELWFRTTSPNSGLFSIVSGNLGSSGNDRHIYLSNGNIASRVWSNEVIGSSGLNLADGQWHHVAHVIGNSIGGQRIYVDGQLVASGNKGQSDFDWQDQAVIGFSADAGYLQGQIDEVRVWNKTRTQAEIQADMNRQLSGTESGLVGYWNFNNISGNTVPDLAGNDQNGTIFGSTSTSGIFAPTFNLETYTVTEDGQTVVNVIVTRIGEQFTTHIPHVKLYKFRLRGERLNSD